MKNKLQSSFFFIPLLLGIVSIFTSCNNSEKNITTDYIDIKKSASGDNKTSVAKITFDQDVINFGTISQGEIVEKEFIFKNTGEENLLISSATGSCGCTIPDWPKHPIKKGEKSKIKVLFNSNGKYGKQHKTITIAANTIPNTTIIVLKGEVLTPNKK